MTKIIESIGVTLRSLREENQMPLRKVAHALDIDQSYLSKIERNERLATKEQIVLLAEFFKVDAKDLLIQHNSDRIFYDMREEKNSKEILKVAKEKIKQYKKSKSLM